MRPCGPAAAGESCRLAGLIIMLGSLVCSAACAIATSRAGEPRAGGESVTTAVLHGKRIELHLAGPANHAPGVLVLYASGDGGWFGAAIDMWRRIASAGYATAGFSSRALLRLDRPPGSRLNLDELAGDYHVMLNEALRALGMPDGTRVILAGWSRGAAFSVLVGADRRFWEKIGGVVAIGLAEGEDLAVDGDRDDTGAGTVAAGGGRWPFDTYDRLSELATPCAVIQATHDSYLSAADARRRFGPDSPIRRFYQVEARNHRFSGGKAAFDAALLDALKWMSSNPPPPAGGGLARAGAQR